MTSAEREPWRVPPTADAATGFTTEADGDADLLIRFLAERDAPCPTCGYNLRNLQGTRCPECGDDLVLKVNVADARLAPLISGLVGLSAGAGLNGLLVLYGLIRLMIE